MDSKKLGTLGEKIASQYLQNKNYQILDRNFSLENISGPKRAEIDIIARKEDTITFFEVKTIFENPGFRIDPEQKVDFQKQRKIIKAAENWLREKKIDFNSKWQIDVIAIKIDKILGKAKLRHFKNVAFGVS